MKLHTNNGDQHILSSDDIIASGKNIGKNLTEIIDNHTSDINDLKQYTKWLYKYGGTGSKGGSGSGSSSVTLQYQVRLAGILIKNNESIILGDKIENENSVPLEIILTNPNINYQYTIANLNVNGSSVSISGKNSFNLDNDFKQIYSLSLVGNNKGSISFLLKYPSVTGEYMQEAVIINYIKNAYVFKTDIVNNNGDSLFINNESLFYTNVVNTVSGVNLKINYDLQIDNDVIVNTPSNILSKSEFILNSIDKKEGNCLISFNSEFIENENIIGDYSLLLSFYSNGVRIYQTMINFTIAPADDVFIKITPILSNAQIYKYSSTNNSDLINEFNLYSKYYTLYNELNINNTLDNNDVNDIISYFNIDRSQLSELNFFEDLKNILYHELTNYKYYVFSTGNIGFTISPYMPQYISETVLYYQIGKLNEDTVEVEYDNPINHGYIQSTHKNKLFTINIAEPGIYVFSIYTQDTHNRIYYYLYVYDKDNTFNWYRSNIENIFNTNKQYLHYFRNGNVTTTFEQYKNKQYIQQYASGNPITVCNINNAIFNNTDYDCFVSIGIQYSYINNSNSYKNNDGNPIISINSNDNANSLKLNIYQDKILLGENQITLFLPKEENYNVNNNSNYHLLSIYKRYLYYNSSPYYEICVYLDGILEGTMQAFTNSSAVWNSVTLYNSNYGINLLEIAYLPHSTNNYEDESGNIIYLDDIAISEYHYKYANECNSFANDINSTSEIINALRKFKETDYGMIEVESQDIIKDISKSISIPIIVFEYNEDSTNKEFISTFFLTTGQESIDKPKWILQNLYYSPGKYELDLSKEDCKILIDDNGGNWYIESQGSSTMQYFVKNLTLGIESRTNGYIYLFTPNFIYAEDGAENVNEAKKSYLPEKAFTLKADMVDSSHCNNTSIGEFVNNNTKKFDIQFDEHSVYHKYIKNCLTGFPVLTFIKINSYDVTGLTKENIYFLGIYNFNLGRDSYFNMGYYDPILLQNNNNGYIHNILKTCDGHKFITTKLQLTNADDTDLRTRDSVIVAEIQGNSSYNDFSQYDRTILAPYTNVENDDGSMFGDFVPKLTVNTQNKTLWHLQRLVEHVAKGGGYIFDYVLKKHLGMHSYEYSRYIENGVNSSIFDSANQVPTYRLQFKRNIEGSNDEENKMNKYLININDTTTINNSITNNSNEYYQNLKNNLIELIFSSEVAGSDNLKEPIIDYPSLAEYYTICMIFGMTDSVMKNLNVKTWNASWSESYGAEYNTEKENILGASLHGKWFVAFYDMDTAFGRYNNGTYLDNSYFSFSDYWLADEQKLSDINIYRDFYPKENIGDEYVGNQKIKIHGYDSPSSYLFAVAKYAAIAIANANTTQPNGTELDTYSPNDHFKMYVPQNIWTKFRALPNTVAKGSMYDLHGLGELRNAQYFVNNYFSKIMNNIPEQLWNMNYRFKYLKRIKYNTSAPHSYIQTTEQNSGFSAKELQSFHGRGIYQVEDWLNYRLHILDAYFNVDQSIMPIKYLDYDNSHELVTVKDDNDNILGYTWNDTSTIKRNNNNNPMWQGTGYYDINPINSFDLLRQNSDVVILKDVFSQNEQGNRYQSINLNIKAMEYSPMVIIPYRKIEKQKYLLINPNQLYNIRRQQTSSDEITFGGSALWTYIDNANSLIASNTLSIYSDKIQNVVVTNGICGTWNIGEMKSLSLLSIKKDQNDNVSNFSGTITIDSSQEEKHPNLTTIILDRTNITLAITKSGIKNIEYTYSSGALSLIDCVNLSSVKLTGSTLSTCTIKPGWSDNINISNVNIQTLSIAPKDENGNNNTLSINNISTLTSLTIEGNFKKLIISNCPLLNKIYIRKPEVVESLQIIKCNTELNELNQTYKQLIILRNDNEENEISYVDSRNNRIINLNVFNNLKEISFNSTQGFNIIEMNTLNGYEYELLNGNIYDNVIRLIGPAFEYTQLKKINSGDRWLLIDNSDTENKTSTFNNSYIGDGGNPNMQLVNNFIVSKNVTNLSYLFNNGLSNRIGGITREDVSMILGNKPTFTRVKFIYENIDNITNMSNMFSGQNIICANKSQISDITLASFKNVINISNIFGNCNNFTYLSKELFTYNGSTLGENAGILNIDSFASFINTIKVNSFTPIINKIMGLTFEGYNNGLFIENIHDEYDNSLSSINIGELLFNEINYTNNIQNISGIYLSDSLTIDWTDLFTILNEHNENVSRLPNLLSLSNSFNHNNVNQNVREMGLRYLTEQSNIIIENSLNIDNENDPIDYVDIHKLNKLKKEIIISNNSLALYKSITQQQIIDYLGEYNVSPNNINKLDYIFNNTILQLNDESDNYELILDDNNIYNGINTYDFKSMSHAFENFKVKNSNGDEIPFYISQRTLRSFNKVTMWNYSFANVKLYKNLPLNMFNLLIDNSKNSNIKYLASNYAHNIESMNNMFSNVRITNESWFAHENYDIDINDYNVELNGSYYNAITTNKGSILNNPNSIDDGTHIINHLVLPFDIFFACYSGCNINECFADSDFEGILPDKIINNSDVNNINNQFKGTFRNLLIIPNMVKPDNNSLRDYKYHLLDANGNSIDNNPISLPTYIFVPSNFSTNIYDYTDAFNFKILLPNSNNAGTEIQQAYFIFKYDSLNLTNSRINLSYCMPGFSQVNVIENILQKGGTVESFDPVDYHNIIYCMMLPDISKLFVHIDGFDGLQPKESTIGLERQDLGFEYNENLQNAFDTYGNIFTTTLITLLYGYMVNIYNESQYAFDNFDINIYLRRKVAGDTKNSFISISNNAIIKDNKQVSKYGIGLFTVLPIFTCNDNDMNYTYTISGLRKNNNNANITLLNVDGDDRSKTSYEYLCLL